MRLVKWVLACAVVALVLPASSLATYPGVNGKIVFNRGDQLLTMNEDGSGQAALGITGSQAQWSADGKKLAWLCGGSICTANADGSSQNVLNAVAGFFTWSPDGQFFLYNDVPFCSHGFCSGSPTLYRIRSSDGGDQIYYREGSGPDWSADGRWVAYVESVSDVPQVKLVGGSNVPGPQLTTGSAVNSEPNFSPDNTIAFTSYRDGNGEIYSMNIDGSGQTNLTNNAAVDTSPEWSPDGKKIVFTSNRDGNYELYSMNADGSGVTRLTNDPAADSAADWQPIPASLVRPKGATPVRVPLVPAYAQCGTPNRQHGAPLAFGSCSPPVQTGRVATMGSRSIGSVLLKVVSGPDVRFTASLTDVRLKDDPSVDMEGSLDFAIPVRISDYGNAGSRIAAGTVVDLTYSTSPLRAKLPCAMTPADETVGSTCSVATSVNAIVPFAQGPVVRAGDRALWQLGQLAVYDGGQDGNPDTLDDNTPMAVQGVFVP